MSFFLIVLTILVIISAGFLVIELLGFLKESSLFEKLSFSWGLGFGLIGLQLFFYHLLNIEWNRLSILFPWISLFILYIQKNKPYFPKMTPRLQSREKIFVTLILLLVLFVGFESTLRPVQAWDAWDNWLFRSKVFYHHNTIDQYYFHYAQDEYPLIIPLVGTFGYIMMGQINDRLILLLFFMFYLCLGGLFFGTARRLFNTQKALLFTFLLLSLQNLIRHGGRFEVGQADLALSYYIFAGMILLASFIKRKSKKAAFLLSVFLGISGQIKYDGMAFVMIVTLISFFSIIEWKRYRYVFLLLPTFLLLIPWQLYKVFNHLPENFLFRSGINIHIERVATVILFMSKEFFSIKNWNLLWIVFFVCLIFYWRRSEKAKLFLVVLFLQWLSYFVIFLMTPTDPATHIENIIDKLYIHLAPIAMLIIAINLSQFLDNSNLLKHKLKLS